MSLFGSLYVGVSGLQMGQNALNTTGHNMSNIDTNGYTRQQVQQGTRFYNTLSTSKTAISWQQVGFGVNYTQVKQVRDDFLDKAYRRESGRSAFYEVSANAFDEVYSLFQELDGEAFAGAIDNLWKSVQDLARDPGNAVNQGVFVQRCSEFLSRAQAVYTGLSEYQDDLNLKIKKQVDTMNAYGERIAELNKEILKIEAGGVEKANDLRDERNLLIDELSAMGNIDCRTDIHGNVLIRLEGKDFVQSDRANTIKLYADPDTGFYTPYWDQLAKKDANGEILLDANGDPVGLNGAKLFNLSQGITTETAVGSLKSMMFARGDHRATYHDLQDAKTYDRDIAPSIMMNMQAEFDQLINQVAEAINGVLAKAAEDATAEDPNSTYMRDGNGDPYQIFKSKVPKANPNDPDDLTIENMMIDNELKQAPSLLSFKKKDGVIDQDTADALKAIFTEENLTLNPNVRTKTNFINYYDDLISQAANSGSVMHDLYANQEVTVDNISAAREQVLGVSSDEEMSNMVMFQNAYNAASRYINVVSELMEHVINTLGR